MTELDSFARESWVRIVFEVGTTVKICRVQSTRSSELSEGESPYVV